MYNNIGNIPFSLSQYISVENLSSKRQPHNERLMVEKVKKIFYLFKSSCVRVKTSIKKLLGFEEIANKIFKEKILFHAQHHEKAELSELFDTVIKINDRGSLVFQKYGFHEDLTYADERVEFNPAPFKGGNCFGASISFVDDYIHTPLINTVAENFSEGIPNQAIITHHFYKSGFKDFVLTDFELDLLEILRPDLKTIFPVWAKRQEITEYPLERNSILRRNKDDLVGFLKENKKELPLELLAKLQNVAHAYQHMTASEEENLIIYENLARQNVLYELNGLQIDSLLIMSSESDAILQSLPTLIPGTYHLSFPAFTACGSFRGGHIITLVIEEGASYLYDPNFAVGKMDEDTVEQLLKSYNSNGTSVLGAFRHVFLSPSQEIFKRLKLFQLSKVSKRNEIVGERRPI
ncbi:MAG: hypothetical protein S4CHLAM123_15040 [Chlamydiales bacterium]|nr:hypothetical protein [Chlamydiales bacterium]